MVENNGLSSSLEDYIESIFLLARTKKAVRAKDVASRMNVTRPSVTGALRMLVKEGLVDHEPYDVITLTAKGSRVAKDVVRRHEVLQDFFVSVLKVDVDEAEKAACSMEHSVSRSILDRLVKFVDSVKSKDGDGQ
jgi:DtxR family Mn-dependent transcriptional regulator